MKTKVGIQKKVKKVKFEGISTFSPLGQELSLFGPLLE